MQLEKKELEVLNKILEKIIEPYSTDDLVDMIRGPYYKMLIDTLYTECFRPHLKYDRSLFGGELEDKEREIIEAMWKKVSEHFHEED